MGSILKVHIFLYILKFSHWSGCILQLFMDYRHETFSYSLAVFQKIKSNNFLYNYLLLSLLYFSLVLDWNAVQSFSSIRAALILWSHNSWLSLVNADSTPELAGISLLSVHRGFHSHLGFSCMRVFAWKDLAAQSRGYLDYPRWSTSIPRRTSTSLPCCTGSALSLTRLWWRSLYNYLVS